MAFSGPYVVDQLPTAASIGVLSNIDISFNLVDADSDFIGSSIIVYINGDMAYNGSNFLFPYNGPDSYFGSTISDGYDGYFIKLDSYNNYTGMVSVRVQANDAASYNLDESWSFLIGTALNTLYFSDGYGLKAINIDKLVGESQNAVRLIASSSMTPALPANNITDIFGNWVRNGHHLILSYEQPDGYGAARITNETNISLYLDGYGYSTKDGQLNDRGILYIVNKSLNRVEAYYGADFRDGYRSPDYYYSTTSTPSIFNGTITCLHIEENASSVLATGTRLYIGTTLGLTRVDTYDAESSDGYSAGLDGYGVSNTYSIIGGGATHEVIGGNVARVEAVSANEEKSIIFVATNNKLGNGGLTQITLNGNKKIVFMTEENGMLSSNDIRDIFGKEI